MTSIFSRRSSIRTSPERENRAQAKQFEEFAENLEPGLAKIAEQIGKLTLVSHRDGQVVGSPHKETVGQWLKPGKPFCEIGDPHQLEAHLILDQGDIHLIAPDRVAWIKVYGRAETTYKCRVSEISKRSREEVPTELSNMAQGEVASKPDPKTGVARPLTAVYEVIIPVDNSRHEARTRPAGKRQDRWRHLYPGLVADALVEQDVQFPALTFILAARNCAARPIKTTGPSGPTVFGSMENLAVVAQAAMTSGGKDASQTQPSLAVAGCREYGSDRAGQTSAN